MPVAHVRPQAARDLDTIRRFIAQDNPNAALRLIDQLEASCQELAEFPHMGVARPELAPNLRMFPFGNYLVFYEPVEFGIDLIRVLHASQDISGDYFDA
jgi:toxin ParE1/3/4